MLGMIFPSDVKFNFNIPVGAFLGMVYIYRTAFDPNRKPYNGVRFHSKVKYYKSEYST